MASSHTFREQRGAFLTYTVSELLYEFPFGAGLGRWGMMHVYFGDATLWQAPPIHVEIQPTGWLLDGGVLLWVAMGGALVMAIRTTYLVAVHADGTLQDAATAIVCLQLTVLCLCLTGRSSTPSSASSSGRYAGRSSGRCWPHRPATPTRRAHG